MCLYLDFNVFKLYLMQIVNFHWGKNEIIIIIYKKKYASETHFP